MPIISDSGRKDSVGLSCTTKAQERCWSSCVCNSHAAEAGAVSNHPTVTKAQIQGCKTLTTDSKSAPRNQHRQSERWSIFGGGVAAFLGEIRLFLLWLMWRNCILGCVKWSHTPRGASVQDSQGRHAVGCPALSTAKWPRCSIRADWALGMEGGATSWDKPTQESQHGNMQHPPEDEDHFHVNTITSPSDV